MSLIRNLLKINFVIPQPMEEFGLILISINLKELTNWSVYTLDFCSRLHESITIANIGGEAKDGVLINKLL